MRQPGELAQAEGRSVIVICVAADVDVGREVRAAVEADAVGGAVSAVRVAQLVHESAADLAGLQLVVVQRQSGVVRVRRAHSLCVGCPNLVIGYIQKKKQHLVIEDVLMVEYDK